jgi:hypothetical protein
MMRSFPKLTSERALRSPEGFDERVHKDGLIRVWRRADTVLDRSAAEAGWTSGPQGDFVAPEVGYTEEDLEGEAFDEDGVVTLYIQGVRAGVGTVQFWLDVDGDGPGGFALADEVKYTALDIDIIGNSLNMEGFDPAEALAGAYGQMTAALAEQMGNNPAANPLGMIVIVNDNDDDGDGIVDWADGFNLDGSLTPNADDRAANPTTTPWATKKETFSKIQIKFEPNPFSDPNAVFYLRYAASPPTSVRPSTPNRQGEEPTHTLPQNGLLRLWTEDGYLARSKDDIRGVADAAPDTGYYVAPGWYHVEQWRRLGLNAGNNVLTLYVEAVKTAPAASYVTEIVVELAPDGEHWLPVPVATFTLRPVRIGLDVNANGSLDDAVDGVMNYLPGYAGGVPVVSSVVSFNESLYEGHQMRIIAEGLGVGAGIDGVAFRIDKVTQHDGYAGNATDSSITAPGNRNDFSFFEHSDLPDGVTDPLRNWRVAELEQSSWSVPLWAKDYGGWARIEVLVVVGQKSTVIHEFTVPNDADGDELADRWERDMVRLWNAQYGATEDETPAFFADPLRTDGEPADPDSPPQNPQVDTDGGHNMPAHRSSGDGLTIAEEYRGFFLHGGGHDGQGKMGISPGHVRLTPVFKELLAETDIMLGVQAMPNAGEMRDLLNDVGRGMSDAFNGAGIRFYWWIDQTAEARVVFDTEAAFDRWAFTRKAFRPLVHLMFIDTAAFVSNETYGITRISGSAIFVSNLAAAGVADGFDYKRAMRNTVAHELTHLLILNPGAGFDRFDHEVDPDPRDGPRQKLDRAYLMVNLNPENRYIIKYSDLVRSRLNLKVKKSVL